MERSEIKPYIAKRVAKELHDGDVVNLGIGLPTMVPDYLDPSVKLTLQSENGFIGLAAVDPEGSGCCIHRKCRWTTGWYRERRYVL